MTNGKRSFGVSKNYGGKIPSEGEHLIQITKAVCQKSRGGDDMIGFRFHVLSGEAKGANWREYIVLRPTWYGLGRIQDMCGATGVVGMDDDPEKGLNPWDQESVLRCLVGRVAAVKVAHEESEYNGKPTKSARAVEWNPIPTATRESIAAKYPEGYPPLPKDAFSDWEGFDLRKVEGPSGFDDGFNQDDIPF